MQYKILVVDDLKCNRDTTQLLLERRGYGVDTAESGDEALKKITNTDQEYAVILLDYRMPEKDGAAVAREIRQVNDEAIILIFSADDSREALKESWMAGAVGFIEKDIDDEILIQTIENNCRKFEETSRILKPKRTLSGAEKIIQSVGMAGQSEALAKAALYAIKYRESREPILLLGETGAGIPMDVLKLIEKGKSVTTKKNGNGLGLPCMVSWAKKNKIDYKISSDTQGTEVSLTLRQNL